MKAGDKAKEKILKAGLKLWPNITFGGIANALKLNSHVNVIYHFKTSDVLKDAIAEYAVKTGHSAVITQLIASDHAAAKSLSQADRKRHIQTISGRPA